MLLRSEVNVNSASGFLVSHCSGSKLNVKKINCWYDFILILLIATKKYELSASVSNPSGLTEKCEVEEISDDQYSIKFVPKELGVHTVSVKHKGLHIPGCLLFYLGTHASK